MTETGNLPVEDNTMARGKDARGGALEVKGFNSYSGNKTFSTADSSNEKAIRGGSGTEQHNSGSVAGGDFSPEAAKNGYPSNK